MSLIHSGFDLQNDPCRDWHVWFEQTEHLEDKACAVVTADPGRFSELIASYFGAAAKRYQLEDHYQSLVAKNLERNFLKAVFFTLLNQAYYNNYYHLPSPTAGGTVIETNNKRWQKFR